MMWGVMFLEPAQGSTSISELSVSFYIGFVSKITASGVAKAFCGHLLEFSSHKHNQVRV